MVLSWIHSALRIQDALTSLEHCDLGNDQPVAQDRSGLALRLLTHMYLEGIVLTSLGLCIFFSFGVLLSWLLLFGEKFRAGKVS